MRIKTIVRLIASCCALAAFAACASFPDAPSPAAAPAHFEGEAFISYDGSALGLTVWRAAEPKAVLVAVHGMNDYAHAFAGLGAWLSENEGVTVYAYDQRGFGRSPGFGRWHGEEAMILDLRAAVAAARAAHPGVPLFVLGHSMGAATVMTAMRDSDLGADGVILAAPGVWGGSRLPIAYRIALNISANILPGKTLTGERAGKQATDNIAILREMFADPLVIKDTRLDAILGVVRLMGDGWDASDEIGGRILFLYGERDEIIPVKALKKTAARLCGDVDVRAYPEGWHLLFRDLQAKTVWRDVGAWIRETESQADAASPVSGSGPAASSCAGADGGRSVAVSATQRKDRVGV
ncbi:MAG: alpha/beta fold hydrolase [Pseudomonadota bacterium]|nr:alpha/beta fold hydrolase [Pseudomonadota bacterium]